MQSKLSEAPSKSQEVTPTSASTSGIRQLDIGSVCRRTVTFSTVRDTTAKSIRQCGSKRGYNIYLLHLRSLQGLAKVADEQLATAGLGAGERGIKLVSGSGDSEFPSSHSHSPANLDSTNTAYNPVSSKKNTLEKLMELLESSVHRLMPICVGSSVDNF